MVDEARIGTTTIVFTDLVGSTAYLSEHGEEAADAARRAHLGAAQDLAARNHGEFVKNLGDGAMLVFGSAVDGVDACIELQRVAAAGEGPAVRIGIAVGDAVVEDGDYFGTPVVAASRLCARAGSGQILASQAVADMAGGRSGHQFQRVGMLSLRGLADPVNACEVLPQGSESVGVAMTAAEVGVMVEIPLPPPIVAIQDQLVGRSQELAALDERMSLSMAGVPQLVIIDGDPGMGKTRLAAEFARRQHGDGAVVLMGRCENGRPYQPFVQVIDALTRSLPDDVLHGFLVGRGAELLRLVPHLGDRAGRVVPPAEGSGDRFQLFEAVRTLVWGVAESRPVVLVLDNLHTADEATLALIRHLAESATPGRVLMVATRATLGTDVERLGGLLDLRRIETVTSLELSGLALPEVHDFVRAWSGSDIDSGSARSLLAATSGNPMFIRELLRVVHADGWDPSSGQPLSEQLGRTQLSDTIRGVLGRRLEVLSEGAIGVLHAAAVAGVEFDTQLLRAVTAMESADLLAGLEEGIATGVIQEVPGTSGLFRFEHDLARRVLYDQIGLRDRALLHQRTAEAFGAVRGGAAAQDASVVAAHYVAAAAVVEPGRVASHCEIAGNDALGELAWEDAARQFRRAREAFHGGTPADAVRLMHKEGSALWAAGLVGQAREVLGRAADLAEGAGLVTELASVALTYAGEGLGAQVLEIGTTDAAAVAMVDRAMAVLPKEDSPERARLLAHRAMTSVYTESVEWRAEVAAEAVEMARRVADDAVVAEVLVRSSLAQFSPDGLDDRIADIDEAIELLDGDGPLHDLAVLVKMILTNTAGRHEEEVQLMALHRDALASSRDPWVRLWVIWNDTFRACHRGELVAADRGALEVVELGSRMRVGADVEHPTFGLVMGYAGQVAMIRFLQGRMGEVAPVLGSFAEAVPTLHCWAPAEAIGWAQADRLDLARRAIEGYEPAEIPWNYFTLTTLVIAAEAARELDDRQLADLLWPILSPYRDRNDSVYLVVGFGSVARLVGELAQVRGDLDLAVELYEQAVEVDRDLDLRALAAYDEVLLAGALARRDGVGPRVRELLDSSRRVATECGLGQVTRVADQIEELWSTAEPERGVGAVATLESTWKRSVVGTKALAARGLQRVMRRATASDDDVSIERRLGTEARLNALMRAVATGFRRDRAFGFAGIVVFSLNYATPGMQRVEPMAWSVHIDGRRARVVSGRSDDATVVVHLTVADFIRFVAGELSTVGSLLDGRVGVEGDLEVAGRLVDMFGQVELT